MTIDTTPHIDSHFVADPHGVRYETASASRIGKVVVGIDGSAASIAALQRGIRIADALGTKLEMVTSFTFPAYAGTVPFEVEVSPESDARSILTTVSDTVFGGPAPVWVSQIVREGSAARVLIDAGEGAEMLIVGSRGHGGIAGLLLGSVSAECAEHASCPVLVMH